MGINQGIIINTTPPAAAKSSGGSWWAEPFKGSTPEARYHEFRARVEREMPRFFVPSASDMRANADSQGFRGQ